MSRGRISTLRSRTAWLEIGYALRRTPRTGLHSLRASIEGYIMRTVILVFVAGCTCGEPPAPLPERAPHFDEWERLVEATVSGDTVIASTVARDLLAAPEYDSGELGSALGFLQLAHADELPAGLAAAAVACGRCHVASMVPSPEGPPAKNSRCGLRLVREVVWSDRAPEPSVEKGLEAALTRCQGAAPSR